MGILTACSDSTEPCMSLIEITKLSVLFAPRISAVIVTNGLLIVGIILLSDLGPVYTGLTILCLILTPNIDPLSILASSLSYLAIFFWSCIDRI